MTVSILYYVWHYSICSELIFLKETWQVFSYIHRSVSLLNKTSLTMANSKKSISSHVAGRWLNKQIVRILAYAFWAMYMSGVNKLPSFHGHLCWNKFFLEYNIRKLIYFLWKYLHHHYTQNKLWHFTFTSLSECAWI